MESDITRPHVTQQLIDYLTKIFPDQCPNRTMSDREIWIAVGSVCVVKHLNMLLQEQIEHQLGNNPNVHEQAA